jgi:ferredoxin
VITRQDLRTFHISGNGLDQARPSSPLRLTSPSQEPELPFLEADYPLYVSPQMAIQSFASVLHSLVPNPEAVSRTFRQAAPGKDLIPFADVREQVLAALASQSEDVAGLRASLPDNGWLVPFTASALPLLYAAVATAARRERRETFLNKVIRQREQLKDLIRLDDMHSPEASKAESIEASLGTKAFHFDSAVLSTVFDDQRNALRRMEPGRRQRIEGILVTLDHAIEETRRAPAFWLFHGAVAPASATALGGRLRQCADSFEAALEFCDQRLEMFARWMRALRAARLEVESAFDPALHEDWLHRFDWQTADAEDLGALPPVVVLEPAEWLARTSFASFGRLLRSGRPVQILIACQGLKTHDQDDDLSGSLPDFGYISIAHREAFVLQTSLSSPRHFIDGLTAMATLVRPAVAVVSVPASRETEADAWRESRLLDESRAFPLYRYDPDRGDTWMQRFSLQAGPVMPDLTAAHAATVSIDFLRHFRVIPESAWDDDQMELTEYLKSFQNQPPLAVPFLWVEDRHGTRQRAVVTRELVNLSRDRQRAYRTFEELAGINNAYVNAAIQKTREEVAESTREEGARQALYQVVAMLTDSQALTVAGPAQAVATSSASQSPAAAVPSDAAQTTDPYIDSFLCTSCNDCMKVNAQVFLYDSNKQAYIGNARAGTFAQLVKAAEGCPARCIHPGSPRPDDKTATPQMIARAAKFQ